MNSHITIIGDTGELTLHPNTSLNITDKNPMFNDVEMFSQSFALPFEKNRHLLKNMDDVNSSLHATDIEGSKFRIVVDGIPLRMVTLKVSEDVKLGDDIEVNFDATNRTFKDMIADMRCRDVSIDDDILIGEKIGDVEVSMDITDIYRAYFTFQDGVVTIRGNTRNITETFQPNALGFSYPAHCEQESVSKAKIESVKSYQNPTVTVNVPKIETSYINVSKPYGDITDSPHKDKNGNLIGWPYCNSRVCYAHHAAEKKEDSDVWESKDEVLTADKRQRDVSEDKSPYWVLPADRPASGICMYVAYFLEKLFKHLGVAYDMTALTDITDFNYLTFFSTQCHYDTKPITEYASDLDSEAQINEWLSSRGCGGQIHIENTDPEYAPYWTNKNSRHFTLGANDYTDISYQINATYKGDVDIRETDGSIDLYSGWEKFSSRPPYFYEFSGDNFVERGFDVSYSFSAKVMKMYANADNFPDATVSEVIESLENSFGVRFCYDAEANKVSVRLLRDMFRQKDANGHNLPAIPFNGTVVSINKKTEKILGVRIKYSSESDRQTQSDNVHYGKRDYNTDYDYVDYQEKSLKIQPYSSIGKADSGDMSCYIDLATGDAFRVKVSADASTTDEMKPAIFEVGALKGVEIGDCSMKAEADEAIKELVSNFKPIAVNDVDYVGKEYDIDNHVPMLVPYVDEDMRHEFIPSKILNPVSTAWGSIDIVYELCLLESYDPSSTDDGASPLQHHEWGLTIGIMRPTGSGSGGPVQYDRGYDGFDNSRWTIQSVNYAITSDSFDVFGNFLGTSPAGSFSLKPCAYKPFRYKYVTEDGKQVLKISTNPQEWSDTSWLIPCDNDERNQQGVITARRRSRGTYDTFLKEFVMFLLTRQRYEVKARCTAAELADIPTKWQRRFNIDGKIGYINQIEYPIDVENGLKEITIDFFFYIMR